MKKTVRVLALLLLFGAAAMLFSGCAKKANLSDIQIGMEKSRVTSLMGSRYETKGSPERMIYKNAKFEDLITPPGETKVVFFINAKEQVYAVCYYIYGAKEGEYKKALEVLTAKYGSPNETETDSALWSGESGSVALTKTDEYVGVTLY